MKVFAAIVSLFASVTALQAQEWVLALGYADFSRESSTDQALIALELHANPFYENGRFGLGWAGVALAHSSGDVFVGAGLSWIYQLDSRWFMEGSVLPGYYHATSAINALGSNFEIRSLLGIGFTLNSADRLSLAITHKSNASTAPVNPGVNSIELRLRRRF